MHCDKCGTYNSNDNYYCDKCGKQLIHKVPTDPYRKISFFDCYKEYVKNAFNAKGVASVKEFYVIFITNIIISAILTIFVSTASCLTFQLITFFPSMTLGIRRLHDSNLSGAYGIIFGYAIIAYMLRVLYVEKESLVIFLVGSAGICLLITLILLSRQTDPNSRWNPVNGYID